MKRFFLITILSGFTPCLYAQVKPLSDKVSEGNSGDVSKVWVSDLGNGNYKNPVLHADYSDPDVCRVGEDYYMTASSFDAVPGLPILHSKDLVNWTLIGHALKRQLPIAHFEKNQHGMGCGRPLSGIIKMNFISIIRIPILVFI
jgi:hypothetical protein